MHSSGEVSQTQKDKYHMISHICQILKEGDSSKLIYKTEVEAQMWKTNLCLPGDSRGVNWEIGTDVYTLQCIRQITVRTYCVYSTGNPTEYSVMVYMGKES